MSHPSVDSLASSEGEDRILILAPLGRDASLLRAVLAQAELASVICDDGAACAAALRRGAGAAVIAEEALTSELLHILAAILQAQPPWSDIPLIVTMLPNRLRSMQTASVVRAMEQLRNVTFLERPVKIMTMVSTLRAALAARKRQYEVRDLLEKQKAASLMKDEFLATLSHELRTPLNVILGYSEILKDEVPGTAPFLEAIDAVHRNAKTQSELINDLLDVSRIMTGKIYLNTTVVDMREIVVGAIESLSLAAKSKRVKLERSGACEGAMVEGDPTRLKQIVWNLLSNAIKFSREDQTIELRLSRMADLIVLEVRDHGEGIAADFMPQIFDRFSQQDGSMTRKHGGLGLGLSIVRHLIEAHGGAVRAESEGRGKGATFTISLPALADASLALLSAEGVLTAQAVHGTRSVGSGDTLFLVVDDQADSRLLLRTFLKRLHVSVREAASAAEAERLLKQQHFDAMICDISMPEESGLDFVARWRRSAHPQALTLPIAALSAYASASDRQSALDAGFDVHVAKPVRLKSFSGVVAELLLLAQRMEGSTSAIS